jgi:cyclopropane-fatty-acyl-phospholipid synthase
MRESHEELPVHGPRTPPSVQPGSSRVYGWGGFAIHAAWHYGCRVTTTTISRQQYEVAVRRAEEAGLSDRVTVLLRDYRELPSLSRQFDKLVSIEMIEAVGHKYYATFFDVCRRMLSRKGLMLIQAITMDERLYERAKRSVDFIQHAVFPGSCITPSAH